MTCVPKHLLLTREQLPKEKTECFSEKCRRQFQHFPASRAHHLKHVRVAQKDCTGNHPNLVSKLFLLLRYIGLPEQQEETITLPGRFCFQSKEYQDSLKDFLFSKNSVPVFHRDRKSVV